MQGIVVSDDFIDGQEVLSSTASDKRNLDSSSASCHSQATLSSIDPDDCNGDDNISLFSDEEDKLYEAPLRY
jgi:hypothetical protein